MIIHLQNNEVISNSPSKIRGGKGALILHKAYNQEASYSSVASRHLPYLRGGVKNRQLKYVN